MKSSNHIINHLKMGVLFAVLISSIFVFSAKLWSPQSMVNPNIRNRYDYIADPGNLMTAEAKRIVNERLQSLRTETTVEMAVALPPDIGDMPIEQWTENVFTEWGIGKSDKDNGLLLVIAPEQRRAFLMTGYGVEGALPDIACVNIINRAVIPNMREDNISAAVNDATSLVYQALTDPAIADELKSTQPDNYSGTIQTLSGDVIWEFVQIIAVCAFFLGLVIFCVDLSRNRKLDNFHKSQAWRNHLRIFFWIGIVSLGTGLIFFLIALFLYRTQRTRPRKCPTCGSKMKRLSEEEDNELLSDSQDFEEKLNTVDYDVWECPECGTVERFSYPSNQMKYTECPVCHTVAMCEVDDVVRLQPTTRREGEGEKIYECQFCHHQNRKRYRIPKKEDAAAALAAGAILGSALGRGGGGSGGGFGGGFGGGATGGGGAGGSW